MKKITKAVIPAAGLGTRMLPIARSVPKEVLPIVDRPVMEYLVREAADSGITDLLIITNRGKGVIEDYFDYSPEYEAKLAASGKTAETLRMRAIADSAHLYFLRQSPKHPFHDHCYPHLVKFFWLPQGIPSSLRRVKSFAILYVPLESLPYLAALSKLKFIFPPEARICAIISKKVSVLSATGIHSFPSRYSMLYSLPNSMLSFELFITSKVMFLESL